MSMTTRDDKSAFHVEPVDYHADLDDLRTVRETVFVHEQNVPLELEWDALDPQCIHVIARTPDGAAIGTGRLTPDHHIGRMAVLREWRGKGVGDALLQALLEQARRHGLREVVLNAQASAIGFYLRHGFTACGDRFQEAGIEHQAMRRTLGAMSGAIPVEDQQAAVAATISVIDAARRGLWIYSRDLDPGLYDVPDVVEALRRFGTAANGSQARILLQDAAAPQQAHAPLLPLAQRLSSVFVFREVDDPVDRVYPSAFVANDGGGYYFRGLGHRFDGECALDAPGRARQLREEFDRIWERSRPVTEYRALGV